MSDRDKGEMKRSTGLFLPRGTKQTPKSHSFTTFVMLYLAACMTARWNTSHCTYTLPLYCPGIPNLRLRWRAAYKGQLNRTRQFIAAFNPGTARPQPHHSWLMTLSCHEGVHHTSVRQCAKMWWVKREKSACSLGYIMHCSKSRQNTDA